MFYKKMFKFKFPQNNMVQNQNKSQIFNTHSDLIKHCNQVGSSNMLAAWTSP